MSRINYVKDAISNNKLTYMWLRNELEKRGIKVRPADLSGIFGDRAETIIETSADIIDNYLRING